MTQAGLLPLLLTQEHCKGEPSLVALFTFVARHPSTKKSTQLNALKPQTAEEKQQFEERQAVADARKAARNVSASAQPEGEQLLDWPMLAAQVQSTGSLGHPNMIPKLPVLNEQAATMCCPWDKSTRHQGLPGFVCGADLQQCDSGTDAKQKWAEQLLGEARAMIDMPSLTSGNAMLMRDTAMQNTFVCQPQQRNIHGRVFGGFIMR